MGHDGLHRKKENSEMHSCRVEKVPKLVRHLVYHSLSRAERMSPTTITLSVLFLSAACFSYQQLALYIL